MLIVGGKEPFLARGAYGIPISGTPSEWEMCDSLTVKPGLANLRQDPYQELSGWG